MDLNNFHKLSQDNLIVPILVATSYRKSSTNIQMSSSQIELFIDNLIKTSIEIDKKIDTFILAGKVTGNDANILRKQFSDIGNINNNLINLK